MRIEFDATIDEFADVHLRLLRHSRMARSARVKTILSTAFLTSLLLFVIIPEPLPMRLFWGSVGAVAAALVSAMFYERTTRRRLLKYCRERLGTDGPVRVQVELTGQGISTKYKGTLIMFEWANVRAMNDMPDCIEFLTRDGGIAVVRKRAFGSPQQLRQFLDLSTEYLRRSQAASDLTSSS